MNLKTLSKILTRDMRASATCRRHYVGMALGWMGRGGPYDNRTFMQRMTDKSARYFWKRAFGFSHARAVAS